MEDLAGPYSVRRALSGLGLDAAVVAQFPPEPEPEPEPDLSGISGSGSGSGRESRSAYPVSTGLCAFSHPMMPAGRTNTFA